MIKIYLDLPCSICFCSQSSHGEGQYYDQFGGQGSNDQEHSLSSPQIWYHLGYDIYNYKQDETLVLGMKWISSLLSSIPQF